MRVPIRRIELVHDGPPVDYDGRRVCSSPKAAADLIMQQIGRRSSEVLGVLCLDVRNKPIAWVELFRGTSNSCRVSPREVYQAALLANAHAVILGHNHPSGSTRPSTEDIAFTGRVADAGAVIGCRLLDSIIVTPSGDWLALGAP